MPKLIIKRDVPSRLIPVRMLTYLPGLFIAALLMGSIGYVFMSDIPVGRLQGSSLPDRQPAPGSLTMPQVKVSVPSRVTKTDGSTRQPVSRVAEKVLPTPDEPMQEMAQGESLPVSGHAGKGAVQPETSGQESVVQLPPANRQQNNMDRPQQTRQSDKLVIPSHRKTSPAKVIKKTPVPSQTTRKTVAQPKLPTRPPSREQDYQLLEQSLGVDF